MWKALVAGLFVLAFAAVEVKAEMSPQVEAGISRLKAALRLNPQQEKHWPRVAAALHPGPEPGQPPEARRALEVQGRDVVRQATEVGRQGVR